MKEDLSGQAASAMSEFMANIDPIIEAANGMRARLEREGWSPTAAEHAALQMLTVTFAMMKPK